jgi:tRNA(Arg) A34 adenosine deaminase TadA
MANDESGKLYDSIIADCQKCDPKVNEPLIKALKILVKTISTESNTQSSVAVAYFQSMLFVADQKKSNPIEAAKTLANKVHQKESKDPNDLDDLPRATFGEGSRYRITHVIAVGGPMAGLHAEMMIIKEWCRGHKFTMDYFSGAAIAASQGACPACAGYLNQKRVWHAGLRRSGKISNKWIDPVSEIICGSEVVTSGISFGNINVDAVQVWSGD